MIYVDGIPVEVEIFNGINLLQPIFKNGEVYNKQNLKTIRERLLANLEA